MTRDDESTEECELVPVGGLWEGSMWGVYFDVEVGGFRADFEDGTEYLDWSLMPCPHAVGVRTLEPKRFETNFLDGVRTTVHTGWEWSVPRAVVATNQGGQATTGVCLDCIVDWAKARDS